MLRLPQRETPKITIHLAALIDIVFLLLIYFLLTSNFIEQDSIDIDLPRVKSIGALSPGQVVIDIDAQGRYRIDNKFIEDKNLAFAVRTQLEFAKSKNVLIKADRRVEYDRVVRAMDVARELGAAKLMLATEPKPSR